MILKAWYPLNRHPPTERRNSVQINSKSVHLLKAQKHFFLSYSNVPHQLVCSDVPHLCQLLLCTCPNWVQTIAAHCWGQYKTQHIFGCSQSDQRLGQTNNSQKQAVFYTDTTPNIKSPQTQTQMCPWESYMSAYNKRTYAEYMSNGIFDIAIWLGIIIIIIRFYITNSVCSFFLQFNHFNYLVKTNSCNNTRIIALAYT